MAILNKIIGLRKIKKSDFPYFLKCWKDRELIKLTSGIYEKDGKVLKGYFLAMLNSEKDNHYLIQFKSGGEYFPYPQKYQHF